MTSSVPFGLWLSAANEQIQAASLPSSSHLAGCEPHRVLQTISLPRIEGRWEGENTQAQPGLCAPPPYLLMWGAELDPWV